MLIKDIEGVSVRAANALALEGFKTTDDLKGKQSHEILRLRNVGRPSVIALIDAGHLPKTQGKTPQTRLQRLERLRQQRDDIDRKIRKLEQNLVLSQG